jgi:predicted signal transduction protein with EAL and GGDEF domain
MEGWTDIMYFYEDAYIHFFVIFYFVCCVIICSFFVLNLTVAVMLNTYDELDRSGVGEKHTVDLIDLGK